MTEKEEFYSFDLNIFNGWFIARNTKRRIEKYGEKSAKNYTILADYYSMREENKKGLYYALKAIRRDRKYSIAYTIAGGCYIALENYKAAQKYLLKAIELGSADYYMPLYLLYVSYLGSEEYLKQYETGLKYLNLRSNNIEYWAFACYVAASFYGYGIEYKRILGKFLKMCFENFKQLRFSHVITVIVSMVIIMLSIYNIKFVDSTGSAVLNGLYDDREYEACIVFINKILIRERAGSKSVLANLHLLKATALMYKEKSEYKKAIEELEKYKLYCKKKYLKDYYYLKSNFAYIAEDYKKALVYANEALLHNQEARTLLIKGYSCFSLERYEEAEAAYRKAITFKDCDLADAYENLSGVLYFNEKYEEALKYLNKALIFNQTSTLYYGKSLVLEKLGKISEAEKCYAKSIELENS